MLSNTKTNFGSVTKFLHWLLFILLMTQFTLTTLFAMAAIGSPEKSQYILWHKSVGITIFCLTVIFVIWRARNPYPKPTNADPAWKKMVAKAVHHSLLLLLILMPILGYTLTYAAGYSASYFGWFTLPRLIAENKVLADFAVKLHITFGVVLVLLVLLHILAALHHHVILKDNVLKRMLPAFKR